MLTKKDLNENLEETLEDSRFLITFLALTGKDTVLSSLIEEHIYTAHAAMLPDVDDTIIQAGLAVLENKINLIEYIAHNSKDCIQDTSTLHKYKDCCARLHSQLIQAIEIIENSNDYITKHAKYCEQYHNK